MVEGQAKVQSVMGDMQLGSKPPSSLPLPPQQFVSAGMWVKFMSLTVEHAASEPKEVC